MDSRNTFHTPATYALTRLDYLVVTAALVGLVVYHLPETRLGPFTAAFVWIDLVGYLPGALWYARSGGTRRSIPAVFPVLYNVTHSFATNAVVAAVWYLVAGRLEWAMLALPIHLCGDRGLFGNIYKPFGLAFQPVQHPAFARFLGEFQGAGRW
jgi:hypothetical protein